jgi:DNA-binding IclR family transcriptional regulator
MAAEGGVAAVERALSILEAFSEADVTLTLADLAKRTGLYKSTILRLSKSLESHGYLLRGADGSYRLGSKLLYLGSLYQRHFRTADLVVPVLRDVVQQVHEGASFYVRDGDKRVCLHRVDATRAVRDSVHEGDHLPLKVGAAGHVLSAFSNERGTRYDEVRKKMYAASFGERDPETAAVACPVFGSQHRLVGALSISGPRYRIEGTGLERLLPALLKYGRELTRILGGDPRALAFPDTGRRSARSSVSASKTR